MEPRKIANGSNDSGIRSDYAEPRDGTDSTDGHCSMMRVRLGDLMPSEQNPRKAFEHLDELAESIRITGGEPINPIVAVADANRYRIVDGERRYRALQQIYDDDHKVSALVFDSYGPAAEIKAMLATDQKDPLSEDERASGFQTALVLNVPYKQVSALSGVDLKSVRKADKWLRKRNYEVPDDVSLELAALIADYGLDDAAAERIFKADPGKRNVKLYNEVDKANKRREVEKITAWLEDKDIDLYKWGSEEFEALTKGKTLLVQWGKGGWAMNSINRAIKKHGSQKIVAAVRKDGTFDAYLLVAKKKGSETAAHACNEETSANLLVEREMCDLVASVLDDLKGYAGEWEPLQGRDQGAPSDLVGNLTVFVAEQIRGGRYTPSYAESLGKRVTKFNNRAKVAPREFVHELIRRLDVHPYFIRTWDGNTATLNDANARLLLRYTCAAREAGHALSEGYMELMGKLSEEIGYDGSDWRETASVVS